jgi:protein-S-isoprenylcysteine O-methyltransferase Ste14
VLWLATGAILQKLMPLEIPLSMQAKIWLAGPPFVLSVFYGLWTIRVLKQAGTPVEPNSRPAALVTCSPFRVSRNPLYLSLLVWSASFSVIVSSFWLFFGTAGLFLLLHRLVIPAEEEALRSAFGEKYCEYKTQVRRWI